MRTKNIAYKNDNLGSYIYRIYWFIHDLEVTDCTNKFATLAESSASDTKI